MVREHPFIGWGLGNFEYGFEKYAYPKTDRLARYGQSTRFAHNEFLQIASELGLPGLIFFLGGIFILLRRIYKKSRSFSEDKIISIMAGANVSVLLVQGFFEFNLHSPAAALVFVYSSAVALAPWNGEMRSKEFDNFKKIILGFILTVCTCWLAVSLSGSCLARMGNYDKAALVNPFNWELQQSSGDKYYQIFQINKDQIFLQSALAGYKRASVLNPDNFYLHRKLGDIYSSLPGEENFRQALAEYKLALEKKPNDVFAFFSLGQLFLRKLEYKKAEDCFLEAIRFEPYFLDCYFNLGLSFAGRLDYKKAVGYYQYLLKLKKNLDHNFSFSAGYENSLMMVDWANFYNYFAAAYFHLGDYSHALESCRKALELWPENRGFLTNLKLIQNKIKREN